MKMSDSTSCKGCTERKVGCHGTCETYISWKKEREEMIRKKRESDLYTISLAASNKRKRLQILGIKEAR